MVYVCLGVEGARRGRVSRLRRYVGEDSTSRPVKVANRRCFVDKGGVVVGRRVLGTGEEGCGVGLRLLVWLLVNLLLLVVLPDDDGLVDDVFFWYVGTEEGAQAAVVEGC